MNEDKSSSESAKDTSSPTQEYLPFYEPRGAGKTYLTKSFMVRDILESLCDKIVTAPSGSKIYVFSIEEEGNYFTRLQISFAEDAMDAELWTGWEGDNNTPRHAEVRIGSYTSITDILLLKDILLKGQE